MASCFEFELLISRSMDEPLSDIEQATLQTHISTCPTCRALREDLLSMHACLEGLSVEPPPLLHENLLRALDQPPVVTFQTRKQRLRYVTTAVASLAVLISAVILGPKLLPVQTDTGNDSYSLSTPSGVEPATLPQTADQPDEAPVTTPESNPQQETDTAPNTMQPGSHKGNANQIEKNNAPDQNAKNNTQTADNPQTENQQDPLPRGVSDREPPAETPTPFAISDDPANGLSRTQDEAETLLFAYCTNLGLTDFTLVFSHVSADGLFFYFTCDLSDGQKKVYCISSATGSIVEASTPDEQPASGN